MTNRAKRGTLTAMTAAPWSARRLALAALGVGLVLGCARTDDDRPSAAAAGDMAPAQRAVVTDGGAGSMAATATDSAAPAAIDGALLHHRRPRTAPYDFSIGPLQDRLAAPAAAAAVTATVTAFFRGLAAGAPDPGLIAPDRRRSLTRSLQIHVTAGRLPRALRIGAVEVADGIAHAAIRLFGQPGRTTGEVYLTTTADGWRIVDLQVDLQRLALPYAAATEEFVPRNDRWLLLR